jgi:hypothetical protein
MSWSKRIPSHPVRDEKSERSTLERASIIIEII